MGIDIVSRPPGKKMQNVTLLSVAKSFDRGQPDLLHIPGQAVTVLSAG